MGKLWQLALTAAIACCASTAWAEDAADSPIGKSPIGSKVENFSLPDFHGNAHALDEFKGRPVVLAILGVECPLAKNYAPRLKELVAEFEKQGVAFIGIDSNVQDSLS